MYKLLFFIFISFNLGASVLTDSSKVIHVYGKVINKHNSVPVQAEMVVKDAITRKKITSFKTNGDSAKYAFVLTSGGNYIIEVTANKYINYVYILNIKNGERGHAHKAIVHLTPVANNETFVLNDVHFTPNKFDLLPESFDELDKLADFLKKNSMYKVEIGGHTSKNKDTDKFNLDLSTNRALAVKKYLVKKGIDENRITHKGYGNSKPLLDSDDTDSSHKNRRVEVTLKME